MIISDRIHRLGGFVIRIAIAGGLGMFLLLGLASSQSIEEALFLLPGAVGIGLVLFSDGHLPVWATPVSVLSIIMTLAMIVSRQDNYVLSLAELGSLLVLTAWTIRRWDDHYGKLSTGLLIAAAFMLPARFGSPQVVVVAMMLTMFAIMLVVLYGVYLRSVDVRRKHALMDVRQTERTALARDLHDFVAHHVTGIVVQAQAAQFLSDRDTVEHKESFARIEQAGIEALTSMRQLVAVLRSDEPGSLKPLGDLGQIADLVEKFNIGDCYGVFRIAPELNPSHVAPEIAATAYRVAQEALTNVRKHAGDVSAVTVNVDIVQDGLEVVVRDNGGRPKTRFINVGGGYGLLGITERVRAVGGSFTAGPRPEGGWEVRARLPMSAVMPSSVIPIDSGALTFKQPPPLSPEWFTFHSTARPATFVRYHHGDYSQ